STIFIIDDETSGLFWKLSGVWAEDTNYSAVGGKCWITKQGPIVARAQWGPQQVKANGYYDVYANIPDTSVPLTERCLYMVREHFGVDSIYVSQASARGRWFKLGNFPFKSGDQFAVMVSSVAGSDTSKYLVADAVKAIRSVQVTEMKGSPYNLPDGLKLSDNYPNPFNPSTTIKVSLDHGGLIKLSIYDVLGQLVKVVDEGYKPAGQYLYDVNMNKFGSGVYFYRLQKGNTVITKKMILLK
ncbi:MAG: T9SS type A sorting domain-containing protein, partial [Candidatus Kryptoniota bacterium]